MLSWRSPTHPQAGGAEVVTEQVLTALARAGHEVTWFSATYPGAASEETVDGICHVRAGAQWSVHYKAWRWLRGRQDQFDVVIDEVNTIPFMTPLYVRGRANHLLIFQLARRYWFRETRGLFRLIAPVGYLAEPLYLQPYRSTPTITISQSTVDDLRRWRLVRGSTHIIPMATEVDPAPDVGRRGGAPRAIVVGRLTQAKHVEEAIDAVAFARRDLPDLELDVVGAGDPAYREQLELRTARLGLPAVFHGRVDLDRRNELLRSAHVHVFASHREGWGLTVTEAAAMGTPTVGYDVPGVRDSIADRSLLAPRGESDGLGALIVELISDQDRFDRVRAEAWERARAATVLAMSRAFAQAIGVELTTPSARE